jgi:hypothetical protein
MRNYETQVPTHLILDSPAGEARIFAVLKADRRQLSDRRLTSRGGRRSTDVLEQAKVNQGIVRPTRVERTFLEPVAAHCR